MTTPQQEELLESEFRQFEPLPKRRKGGDPEEIFAEQCRAFHLPTFEQQHKFAKSIGRLWRFDFAFPAYRLAVEIEGLAVKRLGGQLVVMGRHTSIKGINEDMDKYNTAAMLGWTVLRFSQKMVKPKDAIKMTMRVLMVRGWKPQEGV